MYIKVKKLEGFTEVFVIIFVIILACCLIALVVVSTNNTIMNQLAENTIKTLENAESKQTILTSSIITGKMSSSIFIKEKLDKNFHMVKKNTDLSIVINKDKNGKLDNFYMIYSINKNPFYNFNPKDDFIKFIESLKRKDKESKNRKYYYASKSHVDKEITVKECIIDNDCVFIAGLIHTK